MSQDEPIVSIANLVEALNQSSLLFTSVAGKQESEALFKSRATDIQQEIDRFIFELQTELRRLGHEQTSLNRFDRATAEQWGSDQISSRCRVTLEDILSRYRSILDLPTTAHTRAMLRRQYAEMELAHRQFLDTLHAA